MKRIGIIVKFTALTFAAVLSLNGCSEQTAAPSSNGTSSSATSAATSATVIALSGTESSLTSDGAELLYKKFLSGEITARGKDGETIRIDTYLNNATQDFKGEYTILDMNGDDIPELYIKTVRDCTIFWIKNNEVTVWRDEVNYSMPLNNMAILLTRPGGAPTHTSYTYFVLGYNGDNLLRIDFEEYYEGANGEPLQTYLYQGVVVSKDVYETLTKPLLEVGSDKIVWHELENKNNQ